MSAPSGPPVSMYSDREGPSAYSVTMNGWDDSVSASTTRTVQSPLTRISEATSRPNLARNSGSSASSGRSTLTEGLASLPGGWQHGGVDYLLAQVNIARMREPLDSPLLADFVAALDPVNAVEDTAPGFVWRLQTEDGNATAVHAFEWDRAGSAGVLVNMSVWESVEALAAYVYSDTHRQVLKRRRQWFERMAEAYAALWWIPRGHTPTTG